MRTFAPKEKTDQTVDHLQESVPPGSAGSFNTLPSMLQYIVGHYHNSFAYNDKVDGRWQSLSTETFFENVRRLCLGIIQSGIERGSSIGVLARSSAHWLVMDLAIMSAGCVSVPLFANVSEENFLHQVQDSDMKLLFIDKEIPIDTHKKHSPLLERILSRNAVIEECNSLKVVDFTEMLKLGDELSLTRPSLFSELVQQVRPDDLATIIYTSGSTGRPKGVELTQRNLSSQLHGAHKRFPLDPDKDVAFTCLPLAHIFERTNVYFYVSSGVRIYFADDIQNVSELYREIKPTITSMVPRLLEKIYARIINQVRQAPVLRRLLGQWAFKLAHKSEAVLLSHWQHALADKIAYKKVREATGGRISGVIMGGAPLSPDLCRFFIKVGIPIFQGYGLTESSPVITCNCRKHNKIGTVGRPYPGVEVQISDNNEIIAKGPNIMRGYHNLPKETQETLRDGWLHTGDCGFLDEDNHLVITGRLKEIMKTSNGKMVSPIPIEQALCRSRLIDMAMVIAEGRRFVSCLLFPDFEAVGQLKKRMKMENLSDEQFFECNEIQERLEKLLERVNANLNHWEKVKKYKIVFNPLTTSNNELTPTMKIRRKAICESFKGIIDKIYADNGEQL